MPPTAPNVRSSDESDLQYKKRCAKILQNLTVSFVIRRGEMNIKLLIDEVDQVFNLRLSILDGL
jgi:hypothetical protein